MLKILEKAKKSFIKTMFEKKNYLKKKSILVSISCKNMPFWEGMGTDTKPIP